MLRRLREIFRQIREDIPPAVESGKLKLPTDKVSPFGMVKSVNSSGNTDVLVKILDSATDRITGPVKPFDMQQMMQEMQQRRQQAPQN